MSSLDWIGPSGATPQIPPSMEIPQRAIARHFDCSPSMATFEADVVHFSHGLSFGNVGYCVKLIEIWR